MHDAWLVSDTSSKIATGKNTSGDPVWFCGVNHYFALLRLNSAQSSEEVTRILRIRRTNVTLLIGEWLAMIRHKETAIARDSPRCVGWSATPTSC